MQFLRSNPRHFHISIILNRKYIAIWPKLKITIFLYLPGVVTPLALDCIHTNNAQKKHVCVQKLQALVRISFLGENKRILFTYARLSNKMQSHAIIRKKETWWVDIYCTRVLIILDIYIFYGTKPVLDRVGEVNVCMGPHHVCIVREEYLLAYAKNVSPISHTELLIFFKLDKHTTHTKFDNMILLRIQVKRIIHTTTETTKWNHQIKIKDINCSKTRPELLGFLASLDTRVLEALRVLVLIRMLQRAQSVYMLVLVYCIL